MNEQIEPARVHLVSSDVPLTAPKDTREYVLVPRTVLLNADEPAKQLAPPNPDRCHIRIIANTNAIVLTRSKADAQYSGNTASSITAPNGGLLAAGLPGAEIPDATSEIWGSTGTYPTLVTVLEVTRRT